MYLYKICKILCESRMIRRNSDIRGYWDPKRHKLKVFMMNIPLMKDILYYLRTNLKRKIINVLCGYV